MFLCSYLFPRQQTKRKEAKSKDLSTDPLRMVGLAAKETTICLFSLCRAIGLFPSNPVSAAHLGLPSPWHLALMTLIIGNRPWDAQLYAEVSMWYSAGRMAQWVRHLLAKPLFGPQDPHGRRIKPAPKFVLHICHSTTSHL